MSDLWRTDEKAFAVKLANKVLDRVNADPDDDLAVLARQLLRTQEREEKLQSQVRELAEHLDKTVSVAADAVTRANALQKAPDYFESHEVLGDIVSLESERQALNGGGPGFKRRWDKAMQRACEIFEG